VKNVIDSLHKAGIKTRLNIMCGFPAETLSEAQETLDFLLENHYYNVTINLFSLEKNTEIFDSYKEFGIYSMKEEKKVGDRYGYSYSYRSDIIDPLSTHEAQKFICSAYEILQNERDSNETIK